MMADAWYVDEQTNVMTGQAAEEAIRARSDAAFLSEEGIVRVSQERWETAQRFERTGWMEKWAGASDDRNLLHAEEYEGYAALAGQRIGHAMELGCGPFTNLRVIADFVEIGKVSLLDPLMESYRQLPNCRYGRGTAAGLRAHSGDPVLPIVEMFACPIENMTAEGRKYDLVVMMNVIEHCFDVEAIFSKILAMTSPGSAFIFHDSMYDPEKTRQVVKGKYYEAGHPLMVGYPVMEQFMREHFETLFFRTAPNAPDYLEVCPHSGHFYFIGRRKQQAASRAEPVQR